MASHGYGPSYGAYGRPAPEYGPYGPPPEYGAPPPDYGMHPPPADYHHYPPDYGHHPPPPDYGQHHPPPEYAPPPASYPPPEYGAPGYGYGSPPSYPTAGYGSYPPYGSYPGAEAYGAYAAGYYGTPPAYGYYPPPATGYGPVPTGYGGSRGSGSARDSEKQGGARRGGRGDGGKKRVASRGPANEGGRKAARSGGGSSGSGGRRASSAGGEAPPSDNLFVTGLPAGMANESLKQLFAAHGKVAQCKVLNGGNPNSEGKCAALVRFESLEEAKRMKEKLKEGNLDGLPQSLSVRFADSHDHRGHRGGEGKGGGKGGGIVSIEGLASSFETNGSLPGGRGQEANQHALYIAGLPPDTANVHLYKLFASFGAIRPKGVHAMMNPDGTCKGIAFVNFLDEAAAQAAIMMYNGAVLPDGTTLKVALKQQKGDAAKSGAAPKSAPP